MNFSQAVRSGFNQYAGFTGRASRSELWYWVLFSMLFGFAAGVLDTLLFGDVITRRYPPLPLNLIANLALLVPSLAVGSRRLHDTDRTGWWQLIALTGIGTLVLLVWWCFRGTEGPNRFGPDPLH